MPAKTIKCRVAVVVDSTGAWAAYVHDRVEEFEESAHDHCVYDVAGESLEGVQSWFWVDVRLPVPVVAKVAGRVAKAKGGTDNAR